MAKTEKVSVPRLAGLTAPTDTEILSSEIMLDDQGDGLVLISSKGLCAFFDLGIVFLPALRSLNVEVLQGATGIIVPFFLSMLARDVKDQKDIQDLSEFFIVEDPEFPEWLQKTLKHRDRFIIPWVELVEAAASFDGGFFGDPDRLSLLRERIDGARQTFSFETPGPRAVLAFLMQMRIKNEMLAIGRERFWKPRAAEMLPALTREYETRYGSALKDHMRELSEELERRVRESVDGLPESVVGRTIQEVMQPVLPHYAKIPMIVENQPWLFDRQVAAQS